MILDARTLPDETTFDCDVCVVGSGAAGIPLAVELITRRLNVIVLESGGFRPDHATQSLNKGQVTDPTHHEPLHLYRERRFGGTTTTWHGRCLPLDPIDFEKRSFVPNSGWPITRKDLDPYYKRAHAHLEIGDYAYTVDTALPTSPKELIRGFKSETVKTETLGRFSEPTDLGARYRKFFDSALDFKLILNTSCVNIDVNSNGQQVSSITSKTLDNKKLYIKAKYYVLAAGAFEATRLLLNSNQFYKDGIGNHSGLLGKYYMSHLHGIFADIQLCCLPEHVIFKYELSKDSVYCRRQFSISEQTQREREILNFGGLLHFPKKYHPDHNNSILSCAFLASIILKNRYLFKELEEDLAKRKPDSRLIARHVWNVIADSPRAARFLSLWVRQKVAKKNKMHLHAIPFNLSRGTDTRFRLFYMSEQTPSLSSKVYLNNERDPLGLLRLSVDWRCSDFDVESVVRAHRLIREELQRSGTAHLLFDETVLRDEVRGQKAVGGHQMGITRMANNASEGVVDERCRIHGVDNLYVASSSVFPTSGHANPTLTIVALAIRIADDVKFRLRRGCVQRGVETSP